MNEPSETTTRIVFREPKLSNKESDPANTKTQRPSSPPCPSSPPSPRTIPHKDNKLSSSNPNINNNSSAILDDDEEDANDEHREQNQDKDNSFSLINPPKGYEEIAGPHDPNSEKSHQQSFIIIRRPSRQFNTSKDNFLAQRALRHAGVEVVDWALTPALAGKGSHQQKIPTTMSSLSSSQVRHTNDNFQVGPRRRSSVHPDVITE